MHSRISIVCIIEDGVNSGGLYHPVIFDVYCRRPAVSPIGCKAGIRYIVSYQPKIRCYSPFQESRSCQSGLLRSMAITNAKGKHMHLFAVYSLFGTHGYGYEVGRNRACVLGFKNSPCDYLHQQSMGERSRRSGMLAKMCHYSTS